MTELERLARRSWLDAGARPWQRFGRCTGCRRYHDHTGRPLFVTGRTVRRLFCLDCFDLGPPSDAAGIKLAEAA